MTSKKMSIEDEIVAVLTSQEDALTGYQISREIEDKWEAEGRRSRFLFWTFEPMIPFGTLYRALDKLEQRGLITHTRTTQPDGLTDRFTWQLTHK